VAALRRHHASGKVRMTATGTSAFLVGGHARDTTLVVRPWDLGSRAVVSAGGLN
jgi:hypothetical protein